MPEFQGNWLAVYVPFRSLPHLFKLPLSPEKTYDCTGVVKTTYFPAEPGKYESPLDVVKKLVKMVDATIAEMPPRSTPAVICDQGWMGWCKHKYDIIQYLGHEFRNDHIEFAAELLNTQDSDGREIQYRVLRLKRPEKNLAIWIIIEIHIINSSADLGYNSMTSTFRVMMSSMDWYPGFSDVNQLELAKVMKEMREMIDEMRKLKTEHQSGRTTDRAFQALQIPDEIGPEETPSMFDEYLRKLLGGNDQQQRTGRSVKNLRSLYGDDGIRDIWLDEVSVYSISKPQCAKEASHFIRSKVSPHVVDIIDCCACVGGDTMYFARAFKHVHAVELDPLRFQFLQHNINVNNFTNVTVHNESCVGFQEKFSDRNSRVVYFDPPWGGPGYENQNKIDLWIGRSKLVDVCLQWKNHADWVVLKVPFNFNHEQFDSNGFMKLRDQKGIGALRKFWDRSSRRWQERATYYIRIYQFADAQSQEGARDAPQSRVLGSVHPRLPPSLSL
jgi:hypothetical protein